MKSKDSNSIPLHVYLSQRRRSCYNYFDNDYYESIVSKGQIIHVLIAFPRTDFLIYQHQIHCFQKLCVTQPRSTKLSTKNNAISMGAAVLRFLFKLIAERY